MTQGIGEGRLFGEKITAVNPTRFAEEKNREKVEIK